MVWFFYVFVPYHSQQRVLFLWTIFSLFMIKYFDFLLDSKQNEILLWNITKQQDNVYISINNSTIQKLSTMVNIKTKSRSVVERKW